MRVYLDNCSLQRPLDTKNNLRTALEAEVIIGFLSLCESGEISLISSDVLLFEIKNNPNSVRRQYALELVKRAKIHITLNETLELRSKELSRLGIKPLDALHLASAEEAQADYLCTCDDRFRNRSKTITDISTCVILPLELAQEILKCL